MSDLISRQAAYRVLTEYYHHRTDGQHEALREALERVPDAQQWIPCSERLPDIEQEVLATTTLFNIREVTFAWRINDGEWLIREGSSEAKDNDILAWMPLPEPYRKTEPQTDCDGCRDGDCYGCPLVKQTEPKQVTSKLANVENPTVSACESTMSKQNGKLKTEPQTETPTFEEETPTFKAETPTNRPTERGDEERKTEPSYMEWLEQVVAEYQPDWICDELVGSDEWCDNNCKSNWNSECLKRYYARHFDTADTSQTERSE